MNETNPAVEVENDAPLATNQTAPEQVEDNDSESEIDPSLLEDGLTQEELEEIEYESRKYKVAKELKDAFLRQSDYTKKTQEVAEVRKAIEVERAEVRKAAEIQEQEFKTFAAVHSLDERIKEYEKAFNSPEWQDVIDNDPARAIRADHEYRQLYGQKNQYLNEIRQKSEERTLKQQQESAKREEQTRSALQRDIKGWGIELESKLVDYAKSQGFADHVMSHGLKSDAVAVKTIHKAFLYDQLLKRSLSKPKVEVTPLPKVQSGKTVINKDPNQMSQDEYSKWRRDRIKRNQ